MACGFRSLRCRVLVCHAADTASLATWVHFGKLLGVATLVGFGEKRCRKNLPLGDMDTNNPYASPSAPPTAIQGKAQSKPTVRRRLACGMLLASIAGSLAYTFIDEVVLKTSEGAWPMLFATAGIAVIASVLTRDWLVAPLCCFCGTMSGGLLAGIVRSWSYAQLHICIPLALGFSVPSLIIALGMFWYAKRAARHVA